MTAPDLFVPDVPPVAESLFNAIYAYNLFPYDALLYAHFNKHNV